MCTLHCTRAPRHRRARSRSHPASCCSRMRLLPTSPPALRVASRACPCEPRSLSIRADLHLVPPGGVGQLIQMLSLNALLELTAFAVVGGMAYLVRPGSPVWNSFAEEEDARLLVAAAELARPDGWRVQCDITGEGGLARIKFDATSLSPTLRPSRGVGLTYEVAFAQAEMRCKLLRPSRFLRGSGDARPHVCSSFVSCHCGTVAVERKDTQCTLNRPSQRLACRSMAGRRG